MTTSGSKERNIHKYTYSSFHCCRCAVLSQCTAGDGVQGYDRVVMYVSTGNFLAVLFLNGFFCCGQVVGRTVRVHSGPEEREACSEPETTHGYPAREGASFPLVGYARLSPLVWRPLLPNGSGELGPPEQADFTPLSQSNLLMMTEIQEVIIQNIFV